MSLFRTRPRSDIRFGLVNCLNRRGLGTETRILAAVFARYLPDIDFDVFAIPAGRRGDRFDRDGVHRWRFRRWLGQRTHVMTVERFMPRLYARCRELGIVSFWRPNHEWISPALSADDFAGVDYIVSPMHACADLLETRLGASNVVRNPWILDRPVETKPLSGDRLRFLLNAGRGGVGDRRNVTTVLEAFAHVLPERPDWHLTIKTQTPIDISRLRRVRDRVDYVKGDASYEANLDFYRRADFSIAPSKWEGVGFSLLESLYCGTPVVTTDAPPMNEWVTDGDTGALVPARYADIDVPIPYRRDNVDGVNWVRAAQIGTDALVATLERVADERDRLYERFLQRNPVIIAERTSRFVATIRRLLTERPLPGPRI